MLGAGVLATAATYYAKPQLLEAPLVELNRQFAGLTERTMLVDEHEVHYLEGGRGAPVVLLHGIFGEKDHWVDLARHLTDRHHVFAPDLPGYGESGRYGSHAYDYAAQVERLRVLLERLNIDRVHLAGTSMGGTIAALFALGTPNA
jgi:abhydrolase domain-containing protein 6